MSQPTMQSPRNKAGEICALESDRFAISRRNAIKALFGAAAAATSCSPALCAPSLRPLQPKRPPMPWLPPKRNLKKHSSSSNDLSDQFQTLSEKLDDTIGQIEDVNGQIDRPQELIEEKQEELEREAGRAGPPCVEQL